MLPADLLAVAASAGLAALAARALLAWRHARSGVLLLFAAAFALLALGEILALALSGLTRSASSIDRGSWGAFDALFWAYYVAQTVGFSLLLSTFTRRKLRLVLAAAPLLLVAGPALQLIVVVLALLVVAHAGLNHIERAAVGSLGTASGYALVFLGHALFLLDYHPLSPRSLPGEAVHLVGVALLVAVAYRRRS